MIKRHNASLLGTFRIIAGRWRGRKLHFPAVEKSVRPTTDRTRETLFNWLSPIIQGASCFDGFAGSGALGLEALSRGAKDVVMVERHSQLVATLTDQAKTLGCVEAVTVLQASSPSDWQTLKKTIETPFDVVFLDPPFYQNKILDCLDMLVTQKMVHAASLVYVEVEKAYPLTEQLSNDWQIRRSGCTRQVGFYLLSPVG